METEQAISGTSDATYKVMTLIVTTECDCKNEKKFPRPKQKFPYRVSNVHFKHPVPGFKKATHTRSYDETLSAVSSCSPWRHGIVEVLV